MTGQGRGWALAEAVVAMASSLRTAAQVLHAELGNLDPGEGDLMTATPDRMTYRAVRGTGIGCGAAVDGIVVRTGTWRSLRLPAPGRDSLLLLEAGATWHMLPLADPIRSATCPDGSPGLVFPTAPPVPGDSTTVVRTFEVMELRHYLSGADAWLGLRSVSAGELIQPVSGPFRSSSAPFSYFDASGAATSDLRLVRRVRAAFQGITRPDGAAGAAARADQVRRDSLETVVALRGGSPP